jgi:hypothetical protein
MTTQITIFERASRDKTRFPYRGMCNVEDLWDLTARELDGIFKTVNAELKADQEESLLDQNETSSELDLQVAIIRHIVDVKLTESAAAEQEVVRRQKKDRILSILANKQDESLVAMSEEELARMLEEL